MIASTTANEAARFGRFLNEILKMLHAFKTDQRTYERECMPMSVFAIDFYKPDGEKLSYDQFLKLVARFHVRLHQVFSLGLKPKVAAKTEAAANAEKERDADKMDEDGASAESADSKSGGSKDRGMDITNTLLIMTKIGTEFPRLQSHGANLEQLVAAIATDPANKGSTLKVWPCPCLAPALHLPCPLPALHLLLSALAQACRGFV